MTATKAQLGLGTVITKDVGTGDTVIAEVTTITGPTTSADQVDVTSQESASGFREFIRGLVDPGTVTFDLFYDGTDTSHKALMADSKNVKAMEHAQFIAEHKVKKITGEFQGLADKMSAEKITLAHKVGEEGKLFGAVTALEIAKALSEKGFEIDHRKIGLEKPIKALGEFTVPVKLHKDISANVKIEVVAE